MPKTNKCPICESGNLTERPEKLRDSDSIKVLSCRDCGHVFLDSFTHVDDEYFVSDKFLLNKPFLHGVEERLRHFEHENLEREKRIGPLVVNKDVLEFGCGAGALFRKIKPLAKKIEGLERTASFRQLLVGEGYVIYDRVEDIKNKFDVILMFHVLEHLPDPVASIQSCFNMLTPGGLLYIEVPNINDALLTLYDIEAYHKFHFFKDHLHYFSRQSLETTIRLAGAKAVSVSGYSRFGLSNHLYWLKHGKAGGHKIWSFLETPSLFSEYAAALAAADMSDSLVAQIRK